MLPQEVKKYFWEVNAKELDLRKYPEYIIARILEYGDETAARSLLEYFKKRGILKTFRQSRQLSEKTRAYWKLILEERWKTNSQKSSAGRREKIWPY